MLRCIRCFFVYGFFLTLSICISMYVATPSSKYTKINTPLVNSLLESILNMACLPKEIVLKEDVLYHPGRIHNSFGTNVLRYIVCIYVCAHGMGIFSTIQRLKKIIMIS